MLIVRRRKSIKWRKRALGRMNSNNSDRSALGRVSTVTFATTFRKSMRAASSTPRAPAMAASVSFDSKTVDLEADVAGSGSDPTEAAPDVPTDLPGGAPAGPPSAGGEQSGKPYSRIGSAVSQRSCVTDVSATEPSMSVEEDVEEGKSGSSSDEEEQSDLQMLDSAFKGMSKKLTAGKCKTEGGHRRKGSKVVNK